MFKRASFYTGLAALTVAAGLFAASTAMSEDIASGEWHLLALNGAPTPSATSFAIDAAGAVSGKAPCNRYFGQNQAKLPALSLPNLAMTRMACPEMGAEDQIVQAIGAATSAELRQDHLILTGPSVSLEFVRDPGDKALICLTCAP